MTEGLGFFWDEDKNCEFDWGEYNREREAAYRQHQSITEARQREYLERAAEACRRRSEREYE